MKNRRSSEYRAYANRHDRMRRVRGKARENECIECGGQAFEWAQIHGTDGEDPWAHYQAMCKKCHNEYDYESRQKGIANRDVTNISLAASKTNKSRWQDPEFRAKMSKAIAESNQRRARK